MYCAGDEEFYLEMLREFSVKAKDKTDELESFFEKRDWENYRVLIHAAKSVLKTLGAADLSEQARKLEAAAKCGDEEYITSNHSGMIAAYLELAKSVAGL